MNFKKLTWLTLFLMVLASIPMSHQPSRAEKIGRGKGVFSCGPYTGPFKEFQGKPATIAINKKLEQRGIIVWTGEMAGGWDPQKRCDIVTYKFNLNQEKGNLISIIPGKSDNNLPVLCASPSPDIPTKIISCSDERILMTLRPGDNASDFIRDLAEINVNSMAKPRNHRSRLLRCHSSQYIFDKNGHEVCRNGAIVGINVQSLKEGEEMKGGNVTREPKKCQMFDPDC
ncbi:MAG: COP23 domain-containing protein [Cuspidothrix sp.]